ncbi:MAG: type II toxin-antitoxin system RelE/ParE family toxin [Flavobacteriales bacterium]|nr:type II toxin-antitoxin system RelE/ParE family toxin [Flavobacteriales bacterium]MBK6945488.1 type II toxin-antitoxin system RelE/ParE family toxin [Flavobacteriales bacterium]MBK7241601.1 type II toxin-antitoxin system RelE/ParE family toxin [Flavobacteriales bacterium]MBK7296414.1 type II toxin-antitoxin system RelE/ParE family toxin [Flavobacteriales bacterium]MBK9534958.1 type II toxin-antitoxin system RelE/ParE family toxin [Flavobacteriales bacterium]
MNYELVLRSKARLDIVHGDTWYQRKSIGLGDRFLLELQRCFEQIGSNPSGFRNIHGEFRQAQVNVFPYVVIFRVVNETVVVMRVFHTGQHPHKKFRI